MDASDLCAQGQESLRPQNLDTGTRQSGVEALHDSGIIHTDLKPENAMINCKDGKCHVAHSLVRAVSHAFKPVRVMTQFRAVNRAGVSLA